MTGFQVGSSYRVLIAGGARQNGNSLVSSRTADVYFADAKAIIPANSMIQDRFCARAFASNSTK